VSVDDLVKTAGERLRQHAAFGARTTYRVGGTARAVLEIASVAELERLGPALASCPDIVVLGNGSNLLVDDAEFGGVVLVLGEDFANLSWHDEGDAVIVTAGASLDLPVMARRLADDGVVGFEWAVGVPGTVGGAVAMNAGGHGSDMAASVVSASVWDCARARRHTLTRDELSFAYRSSAIDASTIVLEATLQLRRGEPERAKQQIREIVRWRREHQPGGSNAGSVFRNPPGTSAGQLIEQAGLKGERWGSAQVSEKHANFIQVDAGGSARDVHHLMHHVARVVNERTAVALQSEIRLVGFKKDES